MRIFVEVLHVRVGRSTVEVKVIFLDVFPVITFAVRQTEQTLFKNGIAFIPESEREAQLLLVVGDSGESVFTPVVGA